MDNSKQMKYISLEEMYDLARLAAIDLDMEELEEIRFSIGSFLENSSELLKNQPLENSTWHETVFGNIRLEDPVVMDGLFDNATLTIAGLVCSPPVLQNE
ncbi:hypothetical protein [Candidatus Similichlamydia epinepheli]|uniref:hypothetical protein n=1 Tax=Candidatus Similichlamydia epinepheli TaxID=1903953 RepID=UPI000D395F1E|nr:hypothetical protein [Candidatus Similichlamydia epinepheli]